MAGKKDLDFTYTTIDQIFRLSMGENSDFSGAKYDGDFSLTLEEAQKAKHKFITENLNIHKDSRVLDMGCGWGPFIKYATRETGANVLGITLSTGQAAACLKNGLNVQIRDCRYLKPEDFGFFDAIVSIGSFEHFCSVEDWKNGEQEKIYHDFFKTVHSLLADNGKFYLQTMAFGRNMIGYEQFDIHAPKKSAAHICALMEKEFPGSWLPYGDEMIERCAAPYFKLVSKSNGRLDYIETINQWRKKFRKFNFKKYALYLSLIPRYLTSKEFRYRVEVFRISPNKICFEREIMDHFRMVFVKK